jgi:hypothetical protein
MAVKYNYHKGLFISRQEFNNLIDKDKYIYIKAYIFKKIFDFIENNGNSFNISILSYFINNSEEFKNISLTDLDPLKILIFSMIHIYIMYRREVYNTGDITIINYIKDFGKFIDDSISEKKEELFNYLNNLSFFERQYVNFFLTKEQIKKSIILLLCITFLEFFNININININMIESIINEYLNKEDKDEIDNFIDFTLQSLKSINILKKILK